MIKFTSPAQPLCELALLKRSELAVNDTVIIVDANCRDKSVDELLKTTFAVYLVVKNDRDNSLYLVTIYRSGHKNAVCKMDTVREDMCFLKVDVHLTLTQAS